MRLPTAAIARSSRWSTSRGTEIAEALDSAHKRGTVHRDLKPSNVMLAADGHVKVMDFGVAKHLAGAAVGTMITLTGEIVGTMNYMSPEQINGAPVDARSDVFAFGLLLYEMAFLEMYRGRYDAAIKELRQAILINQTNRFGVSEYRDRLILARALAAKGMSAAAGSELDGAARVRATLSLGPEWLRMLAKLEARRGRVKEARRLVDEMSKRAWDATAGSSANRSMDEDQTYINQAQGEVALAEGRFDEALRLVEAASLSDRDEDLIESVAAANVAAGHLDVAAKRYEELLATPRFGHESQELWFRSHVTVGEIYERLGRADEARRKYEALVKIWKDGDSDLVALTEARARLAKLGA
ncbi:MAG TPA: protein kinase [Vicinamibacterales bacterium]|nr:protein kinase [Vicinamibacterales bacterium]